MNKKLKFNLNKLTKETFSGTQVGVLLEDIDEKLTLVAESYGSVVHRLDTLENGQESFHAKLDKVEVRLSKIEISQEAVGDKLDRMETKLDATFEAVGEVKVEVTDFRDDLERVK